jgi:hypothetical protein
MNIIDIQDQLKNFSENQLISEMQMPSGSAPQFLVLSEIQRRKRVRDDFSKREAANQQTVAQEAVAAAGVPMQGIAGMSEAMAPQSAASEGIGTIMPQSMRQAMPTQTEQPVPMAEGGIVRAQQGTYFPSTAELYGLYGQESGYGKNLYGSDGEIGPMQILPTTAIMPGYGIKSLFPDLESAIQSGDYENAAAAYAANRAMVDEALMSGKKVEPFVIDYLNKAEGILGNRNLALLAFNQGIAGTEGYEGDPTETNYVSGVTGNMEDYGQASARNTGESILSMLNPVSSASASTLNPTAQTVSNPMPDIPQEIIKDETGRPIGDASYGKRIRAAMETGNVDIADQLVAQGVNEANFFEKMMKNKDPDDLGAEATGMGIIDTPIGPGTLSPSDITQVLPLDPTQKTASGDTVEESVKKAEPAKPSERKEGSSDEEKKSDRNVTFEPIQYAGSDLENEIKKLQGQMEKSREQDKWLAIAQAGLSLMSSKEPTLLGAAGEAGVSGLKAFREAQDRYQEGVVDLINARAKISKDGDKKGLTASSAVSRLNAIMKALNPEDVAAPPLSPENRQKLEEEALYLRRDILNYPDIVA